MITRSKGRTRSRTRRICSTLAAAALLLVVALTATSGVGTRPPALLGTHPLAPPVAAADPVHPSVVGINAVTSRLPELRTRVYDAMADAGVKAVRLHVEWPIIEPARGQYDWRETDSMIDNALQRGMDVLGVVTYTPAWAATPEGRQHIHPHPADPQMFADFTRIAAERYRGKVRAWEVWNEPNVETHWAPKPDGALYADLLKRTYTALKAVDPANVVLTGGTSPTVDAPVKISPVTFVSQLYANGAGNYFDAVAMHPYSTPNLLSAPGPEWSSNSDIAGVTRIMQANGQGDKKIWFTEFGAPTVSGHEFGVPPARQAEILVDGIDYLRGLANGGPIYLFDFQDIQTGNSYVELNYGLLRTDFTPKPSYDAVLPLLGGN